MTALLEAPETELLEETETLANATAELVIEAQAGDREAFGELFERYRGAIFHTAYSRLGNYAEAEELVQEVSVQALRKLDQLREPRCVGAWLRSIAVRQSINRLTRRKLSATSGGESLDALCVENDHPAREALRRERQSQVRAGLERLGRLDRETLVAFYVEGQSLIEMSEKFESPVGTIKRRLHVARKRLARELEDEIAG